MRLPVDLSGCIQFFHFFQKDIQRPIAVLDCLVKIQPATKGGIKPFVKDQCHDPLARNRKIGGNEVELAVRLVVFNLRLVIPRSAKGKILNGQQICTVSTRERCRHPFRRVWHGEHEIAFSAEMVLNDGIVGLCRIAQNVHSDFGIEELVDKFRSCKGYLTDLCTGLIRIVNHQICTGKSHDHKLFSLEIRRWQCVQNTWFRTFLFGLGGLLRIRLFTAGSQYPQQQTKYQQ